MYISYRQYRLLEGSRTSGFFNHQGRPGFEGGSLPDDRGPTRKEA